jgi:hypothetical protein
MPPGPAAIREAAGVDAATFRDEIVPDGQPVVLRGIAAEWPAVAASRRSSADAAAYLARFDRARPAEAFVAHPDAGGRYFYRDDMKGFNFERRSGPLRDIVGHLLAVENEPAAASVYVGSTPVAELLPGFAAENAMPLLAPPLAEPRIWIGNRSIVSTHFDESDNIACVVAGRRRFTVFPPDQVRNLYVGPLDHTMAGQPASMVSVRDPDFERYPRFRDALAAAQTAELGPGDAIYIPLLWWHNVEALDGFNILVNYWWRSVPPEAGSAFVAMVHAIASVSCLPQPQRDAWRAMFEHYVFRPEGDPAAHLAPEHRGILGQPTPELRRRVWQFLQRMIAGF